MEFSVHGYVWCQPVFDKVIDAILHIAFGLLSFLFQFLLVIYFLSFFNFSLPCFLCFGTMRNLIFLSRVVLVKRACNAQCIFAGVAPAFWPKGRNKKF